MKTKNSLYYDGTCNLCNTWMQIIKQADHKQSILFIPIQSEKGIATLGKIEKSDEKFDSIIYEKAGVYYTHSDAAIHCLSDLGGLWKTLKLLRWIPKRFRDFIYKTIAKNRYMLFGKTDLCETTTK